MATTPAALLSELAALRKATKLQGDRLKRAGEVRQAATVARMVDRAFLDASALITLHVGGGAVARSVSPLPQRRWVHAVALLRLAGLATGHDARLTLAETPQATLRRLHEAAAMAKAHPSLWGARMPRYARPQRLQ